MDGFALSNSQRRGTAHTADAAEGGEPNDGLAALAVRSHFIARLQILVLVGVCRFPGLGFFLRRAHVTERLDICA